MIYSTIGKRTYAELKFEPTTEDGATKIALNAINKIEEDGYQVLRYRISLHDFLAEIANANP